MIVCLCAYFVQPKSEVPELRSKEEATGESNSRHKGKKLRLVA